MTKGKTAVSAAETIIIKITEMILMSVKDKLFGGYQNPQQPRISEDIVNPYYNIAPDGTAQSSSLNPGAAPNPFMQQLQQAQPNAFIQQHQPQQPVQNNYPVIDNNQRFDIAQPDTPNAYYDASGNTQAPQQQYDPNYQQAPQQQYDPNYQQAVPQQQYDPNYQQAAQQQYDPNYQQAVPQQQYDPNYQQAAQQQYDPNYQQAAQQYNESLEQTMPVQQPAPQQYSESLEQTMPVQPAQSDVNPLLRPLNSNNGNNGSY